MKFNKYINEEIKDPLHVWNNIKDDVDYAFLKAVKNKLIYRGTRQKVKDIEEFIARKDRKPLNTSIDIHNFLDEFFLKKFGWKARSEGVFANSNNRDLDLYGHVHIFFPIRNYKFIWSDEIYDLYNEEEKLGYIEYSDDALSKMGISDEEIEYIREDSENLLNSYTNKNLDKAIKSGNEIMFKCMTYYLVSRDYEDFIKNELKKF